MYSNKKVRSILTAFLYREKRTFTRREGFWLHHRKVLLSIKTLIAITDADLKRIFFPDHVLARLRSFSEIDWLETRTLDSSKQLADIIGDYDACLTSWGSPHFSEEVLNSADKLQFIGHIAGSVVSLVHEEVFTKKITITSANPVLALSTAEGAVALMMAGAWDINRFSSSLKKGQWSNNNGDTVMGISGQTIGLVGYGAISQNVIRMLKGFPVVIKVASRYCTKDEADQLGVELCSLQELLQSCQIISIHSTLTASSKGMIGKQELALIRDGALLVNTARAEIIDEASLMEELKSKRFSAVLDVYHHEPLLADDPLLTLDNVLCLPHICGFSIKRKQAMGEFVVEDLYRFTQGLPLQGGLTQEDYKRQSRH